MFKKPISLIVAGVVLVAVAAIVFFILSDSSEIAQDYESTVHTDGQNTSTSETTNTNTQTNTDGDQSDIPVVTPPSDTDDRGGSTPF